MGSRSLSVTDLPLTTHYPVRAGSSDRLVDRQIIQLNPPLLLTTHSHLALVLLQNIHQVSLALHGQQINQRNFLFTTPKFDGNIL